MTRQTQHSSPHLRTRIVGLEYHPGKALQDHSGNWRTHPQHQRDALGGVLREVGIAGALLVYHSERHGGLTVIDGHLRKGEYPEQQWPCLMTDLTDAEADYLLPIYDYLTVQAEADKQKLEALLQDVQSGEVGVQALLAHMGEQYGIVPPDFQPVGVDEQGRLDEKAPKPLVTCPECGHEFEA